MTNFIIDCESSGACPTVGDLIEFAAVAENGSRFKSDKFPPLWDKYDEGAYKALGINRAQHEAYTGDLEDNFRRFEAWIAESTDKGYRAMFWSDNLAFDWQWINWGFHHTIGKNPFGFSGRRIGDLFAGANGNIRDATSWKKWRRTKHTHDPLDDAIGNMEAFKEIRGRFRL